MPSPRRTRPSRPLRLVPALALPLALALSISPAAPADPGATRERPPAERDWSSAQTSDGLPGEVARDVTALPRTRVTTDERRAWQVAPGVRARVWDRTDARGANRLSLLVVEPATPGLLLDYADRGSVQRTATVSRILARDDAVAGVNADFFDIADTGAPLGTGLDRERGLRHARRTGWNESFFVRRDGVPAIGTLPMRTTIRNRPNLVVTNLNSHRVADHGIGAYTAAWGPTPGYAATEGRRGRLRAVEVTGGRVTSTGTTLPSGGRVQGLLLVGRGRGAERLGRLSLGDRVRLEPALRGRPQMAVTGNKVLLRDGVSEVVDDVEMHPRTAVGIDRDTGRVLILVVDGRQDFSRGLTMVELADQMRRLGAEDALNLDGGGSSTLVADQPDGEPAVVNSPSDGAERRVANALQVTYTAPS